MIINNWYLSTHIAQYLLSYKNCIAGTMHTNRRVPQHINSEDLDKGSSFVRNENMLLVCFSNEKYFYVLTAFMKLDSMKKYLVGNEYAIYLQA